MATKKITLNELRTIVKQIIKEESGNLKRKLEDRGYTSDPPRYIYLGSNPDGFFSYYFYPETKSIETFKGRIEGGNHMSYSKPNEFFKYIEPIDTALEYLNMGDSAE